MYLFPLFFACSPNTQVDEKESVAPAVPVLQQRTVKKLPWPKNGVLIKRATTLEACLDKVPSCQCQFNAQQESCVPQFVSEIVPLPNLLSAQMRMHTWTEECPTSLESLRLLRVLHWTELDQVQWGEIILTERVVADAEQIFEALYLERFPIHSLKPAVHYEGSDEQSMADNNSSAFNCRKVKGSNRWSEHSYGEAIDINPLWNPWVRGATVYPKNAGKYVDRTLVIPGMINKGNTIVSIFEQHGWRWGSQKKGVSDYQHFSRADHESVYAP